MHRKRGSGKSEVIQVKAWNTEGWGCEATVVAGGDVRTGIFSRSNIKECRLGGTAFGYTHSTVAP